MRYRVHILVEAEDDLYEIARYVAVGDSPDRALALLDKLEAKCKSLATLANRGHVPPELKLVGISEYREVHFKPYRILYRVQDRDVYVYAVLDGRRDLTELLQKRLLRPT